MMAWITTYLYYIAGAAALAILLSFVRFQKPVKWLLVIGLILAGVCLVDLVWVAFRNPGNQPTEPERPRPGPRPPILASVLERLHQPWNSEETADWPVAETLATLSHIAYLPPVDADKAYATLGFEKFMPIVIGSMIGYVISIDDVTVIVFRGTDGGEAGDWFKNLDVRETQTEFGVIHDGFYSAYISMKPQIEKLLLERKPTHLWITGHSLGGALAAVAAYDLVEFQKRPINGVITFGQPMFAKAELVKHIDTILLNKYAVFVNRSDVVPRAPPNYLPCGSLVKMTDTGVERSPRKRRLVGAGPADQPPAVKTTEIKPMTMEQFEAEKARLRNKPVMKSVPDGSPIYEGRFSLIEDHSMDLYVQEVRKLVGVKATGIPP